MGIDNFSKKLAKKFLVAYPQWDSYAAAEIYHEQTYLTIRVPAPMIPTSRDLLVSTYGYRITVHFDWFHAHFGGWQGDTIHNSFEDAKNFVDRILSEEVVVVIKKTDNEIGYSRAGWCRPDMLQTLDPAEVSYTRSWWGTYDKNFGLDSN